MPGIADSLASMDQEELFERIDAIVEMLETSWIRDVYPLQVSMAEYDRLAKPLDRYPGSMLIQMWHVDYLLIGCRRLVDDGTDVISVRRALINLRTVGDELTPVTLAAYRSHIGVDAEAARRDAVEGDLQRELGIAPGDPIGKPGVQADLNAISQVADRVKRLVTHGVAHRLDKPRPPGLTRGEVEKLLENLHEIYVRWSIVLRATDVFAQPGDQHMLGPVVRALELFDWESYIEAQTEALSKVGPLGGVGFDELERRARIEFRFD